MQAILDAIKAGDVDQVRALLQADASLLAAKKNGVSLTRLALYVGKREVAEQFVLLGAPFDLFDACALGDLALAEKLVTADPSLLASFSEDGHSPLGLACFFGHTAVAMLLIERGADVNAASQNNMQVRPLHSAVARKSRSLVELLLARGADVDAKQQHGYTPLHGAAAAGDQELVEVLVQHHADKSAKSDDGKTPQDLARERGHDALAQTLA